MGKKVYLKDFESDMFVGARASLIISKAADLIGLSCTIISKVWSEFILNLLSGNFLGRNC